MTSLYQYLVNSVFRTRAANEVTTNTVCYDKVQYLVTVRVTNVGVNNSCQHCLPTSAHFTRELALIEIVEIDD